MTHHLDVNKSQNFFKQIHEFLVHDWTQYFNEEPLCNGIQTVKNLIINPVIILHKFQGHLKFFHEILNLISDKDFQEFKLKELHSWTRSSKTFTAISIQEQEGTKSLGENQSLCQSIYFSIFGVFDKKNLMELCFLNSLKNICSIDFPVNDKWRTLLRINAGVEVIEQRLKLFCSNVLNEKMFDTNNEASDQNLLQADLLRFKLFILAQVCRRVLIVVGNDSDDFKSSVYIPVLIPQENCAKIPIYLAYQKSKFAPLIMLDEPDNEVRIRDNCIPLMDRGFNLFEFPFLTTSEEPMVILDKYAYLTTLSYTTSSKIVEIPAVRYPFKKYKSEEVDFCSTQLFEIFFSALKTTDIPKDSIYLWEYIKNVDIKTQIPLTDESKQVTNNYKSDFMDLNTSYSFHNAQNHILSQEDDAETFEKSHFSEFSYPIDYSSAFASLQSIQCTDNCSEDGDIDSSPDRSHNQLLSSSEPFDLLQNGRSSPFSLSDSHWTASENRQNVEETLSSYYFKLNNPTNRISNSNEFTSTNRLRNSLERDVKVYSEKVNLQKLIYYMEPSHVVVKISENSNYPKLALQQNQIEIIAYLKRNPFKQLQLFVQKPTNVQIQTESTTTEELEMKLINISDVYYNLHIKLPRSIIMGENFNNDVSSLWLEETMAGSIYVDFNTHHEKCRTGGCMGIARSRFKNLCSSCHQSWVNRFSLSYQEEILDNSDTSDEDKNSDQIKRCPIKNCRNEGERKYYGLCQSCFNKPMM